MLESTIKANLFLLPCKVHPEYVCVCVQDLHEVRIKSRQKVGAFSVFRVDVAPRQTILLLLLVVLLLLLLQQALCDIVGGVGKACREQPTSLCFYLCVH